MARAAFKLRRSPYMLASTQVNLMEIGMERDFPHPSTIPGAELKEGKGPYSSNVWLIHAEVYYNHLIANGYQKCLEEHGIINAEVLVGMYGAWKYT